MLRPRGIPHDLDPDATNQIERTFLAVRIVRGSLLLLFLTIAVGAVMAKDWPAGVAAALALTAALQAARLTLSARRYRQTGSRARANPPRRTPAGRIGYDVQPTGRAVPGTDDRGGEGVE